MTVRRSVEWAEDFLFAGTSALLLFVAGSALGLRSLSLLALVPFLYRTIHCTRTGRSARLGFLLGIAYFGSTLAAQLPVTTAATLASLAVGVIVVTAVGWVLGYCRTRFGFYPVVVGALWVVLELILSHIHIPGTLSAPTEFGSGFVYRASVLCGSLIISFAVVVFNAIIVWIFDALLGLSGHTERQHPTPRLLCGSSYRGALTGQKLFLIPDVRGPPSPCTG